MGGAWTTSRGVCDEDDAEETHVVVRIGSQTSHLPPAPKVFWTYWQDSSPPPIVQACTRSWAKHHPDFEVRVVTKASLRDYLPDMELYPWIDSPARESDLVRLMLLARHGGVWLDASILLAEPLTFMRGVVAAQGHGPDFAGFYLQGFTTNPDSPVLESWALASRPGAPFAAAWLQELESIPRHPAGVAAKLREYEAARVDTQRIHGTHYLLIHVAAQFLMQHRRHVVSMELACAEEGPYRYLKAKEWDTCAAVRAMLADYPTAGGTFKMRGSERGCLADADVSRLIKALS